jgi:hypothetical protein
MPRGRDESEKPVIRAVRRKIWTINLLIGLIIIVLLVIVIRPLVNPNPFATAASAIGDIPVFVIAAVIFIVGFSGLFLSHRLTGQAVRMAEDYSNRLDRLLNITKDLREEVYGDILLEKVMDYALAITHSEAGALLLVDEKNDLTFKIVRGEKAPWLLGATIEKGKGIAGWVALEGQSIRIADAKNDERFDPRHDVLTGSETKSMLCAPLKTKGGIIGVIELVNKKGGYLYRPRDEEVICYLAGQAAISIMKTKFYEDQKNYEIHLTDMLLETLDYQILEKKGHARRVARYSNIIAKALDMPEDEKKRLYFACLLHDVGFLKISSDEAFKKEAYMKHPIIGYEMIKPITFYADIAPFILYHHQRYDGYGYPPSRLRGEEIPLEARIIAIGEAFDAMTSTMSYRLPVSFEDALEELQGKAGSQFDPRLVEIFVRNVTQGHMK